MSRWTRAKEKMDYIMDDATRETLYMLFELIRYVYDSIPEVE